MKFLYGQVTEVLKARRGGEDLPEARVELPAVTVGMLDGVLQATLVTPQDVDPAIPALREFWTQLADYQDGLVPFDDAGLPKPLGDVRGLLEALYIQHRTFRQRNARHGVTIDIGDRLDADVHDRCIGREERSLLTRLAARRRRAAASHSADWSRALSLRRGRCHDDPGET